MACNALVVPGSRFSTNLLEVLHDVKKRISILWIIVVLNDFMYIISPALIPGRHLMEDKQVLLGNYYDYYDINNYLLWSFVLVRIL